MRLDTIGRKRKAIFQECTMNIKGKSDANLVFNQVRASAHNYPKLQKWPKWVLGVNAMRLLLTISHTKVDDWCMTSDFNIIEYPY